MVKTLQGLGYLISGLSVLMLGAVAWQAARADDTLFLALVAGMVASLIGMLLRWLSFLQDQREKEKASLKAPLDRSERSDRAAPTGQAADI
jgi:membrane protein DedA with SNARE-associated domain